MDTTPLGHAKRVKVTLGIGTRRDAWDCRRFGFGRIVAPKMPAHVELEPGTDLDLFTGEVRSSGGAPPPERPPARGRASGPKNKEEVRHGSEAERAAPAGPTAHS